MPKIKTNRAAAKRFRVTGSGKIKRNKAYKSHIFRARARNERDNLRHSTTVAAVETKEHSQTDTL